MNGRFNSFETASYRVLVHDRDGIFAPAVDEAVGSMSLRVLKTPVGLPTNRPAWRR